MMRNWANDEDMWVRRTAILCQLASKDLPDVDLLWSGRDHTHMHCPYPALLLAGSIIRSGFQLPPTTCEGASVA